MQRRIMILSTFVFFSTLSHAEESKTHYSSSDNSDFYQTNKEGTGNSSSILAEADGLTSDPRWYKSRAGRQEYLKGGSNYPGRPDQYSTSDEYPEHHQTSPINNPRWYKTRSGRQEYLEGNHSPGRPSQYTENGNYPEYSQTSSRNASQWDKNQNGR